MDEIIIDFPLAGFTESDIIIDCVTHGKQKSYCTRNLDLICQRCVAEGITNSYSEYVLNRSRNR